MSRFGGSRGCRCISSKAGRAAANRRLMKRLAVKAEQKGEPIQRIHCASDPDSSGRRHLSRQARRHRGRHRTPCHGAGRPGRRRAGGEPVPHTGRRRPPRPRRRGEARSSPRTLPCAAGPRGISHLPGACCWTAAGLRRAVPTSRKSAATSSGSAPGLLPRLPEGASASEELRLLSAITPKGPVFYRGTVQALADRYVVFRDDYGAVVPPASRAYPGRGAGPGLPHHHLPLRHAPRRQDRPSLHPGPAAGLPHRQPVAPGAAARRAGRAVYPFRGPGKSGGLPRPSPLQRAGGSRASGTGRRPDGTGQEPATTSWRLTTAPPWTSAKVDEAAAQCAGMLGLA